MLNGLKEPVRELKPQSKHTPNLFRDIPPNSTVIYPLFSAKNVHHSQNVSLSLTSLISDLSCEHWMVTSSDTAEANRICNDGQL
jgi:hypothetical protein